jgi:hypothetical protein
LGASVDLARLENQFDFLVLQPVETARLRLVTTQHDPLDIVISEGLERELNALRAGTSGSLSGIFSPQSTTWRINREAAIFSGAGRALLLQLADP